MRRFYAALSALALVAGLVPAAAQTAPDGNPAVARLNQAGYARKRHCTAVAIAPRVALTAAHCLTGAPSEEFHILFGYGRMAWAAEARIAAVRPLGGDLVALCVDGDAPAALALGSPPLEGEAVRTTGYGRPRIHLQHGRNCRVLDTDGREMLLDCGASEGDSGGPVLDRAGGLVGIVSRANPRRAVAAAVPADAAAACDP